MRFRRDVLSGVSLLCLVLLAPVPGKTDPLKPRVEVSAKGGSDRTLLTTEIWAPLVQDQNSVLYGDIRLMGDNDENREGNLGIGYRTIKHDAVYGVHGWIDRRRTENDSTFHQVTIGAERLGHVIDARANAYIPLNKGRTVGAGGTGGASDPYLVGSGLYYDVNGFLMEIPQYGMDGEIGVRLPLLEKHADAIRVFGGGYHFFRKDTDNTTGFRIRTEAQINSAFSVGARYQYDRPRGSQAFLEATLKFPFSAKKLYQTDALRARLDESPERDVDIVTATKQAPTQKMVPVLNTVTGEQQRILHVDNTNTQPGDGSKENPYSTLASAQAALQDNDILYINHGDGTTGGMDQGLMIYHANVTVIGAGSDFIWDSGKFSAAYGSGPRTGTVIIAATAAPTITNTQSYVSDGTIHNTSLSGNGIIITGSNAYVSGLAVQDANASGVFVLSQGSASNIHNVTLSNLTITGSKNGAGLNVDIRNGGTMGDLNVAHVTSTANSREGTRLNISDAQAGNILLNHVQANNHTSNNGLYARLYNAQTGDIVVANTTTNQNSWSGMDYRFENSTIGDVLLANNQANSNMSNQGIQYNLTNVAMGDLTITDTIVENNRSDGLYLSLYSGSTVGDVTLRNISMSGSTNGDGMNANISGSTVGSVLLDGITATNNSDDGYSIYYTQATVGTTTMRNIYTDNNPDDNIFLSLSNGTYGNVLIEDSDISNKLSLYTYDTVTPMDSITLKNINLRGVSGDSIRVNIQNDLDNLILTNITVDGNYDSTLNTGGYYGMSLYVASHIKNIVIADSVFRNNRSTGLQIQTSNAIIDNLSLSNITASNNRYDGIAIDLNDNLTAHNITLDNVIATNNGESGLDFNATTYGGGRTITVDALHITNSVFSDNQDSGIEMFPGGGTTINITIANTSITGNREHGIYAYSYGTLNLNLGNGTTGSGYNRIFGNGLSGASYYDIYKSFSGTLNAQYNWWGQPSGPLPGRVDGASIVTTNPLAEDPAI